MFTIFITSLFLSSALADVTLLTSSCQIDIDFDYGGDRSKVPDVTCGKTCSTAANIYTRQRLYYKDSTIQQEFGLMVEIVVTNAETAAGIKCNLVNSADNAEIEKQETELLNLPECVKEYSLPSEDPADNCQEGYFYSEEFDKCYSINDFPLEWPEAKCNCEGDQGTLAIIDSREKQEYFQGLINDDVWIGLTDQIENGKFIWQDKSEMVYNNFDPNGPTDEEGTLDCVGMSAESKFQWQQGDCATPKKFICEQTETVTTTTTTTTTTPKPTTTTTKATTTTPKPVNNVLQPVQKTTTTTTLIPKFQACPKGWTLHGKKCYTLGSNALDYSNSQQYCKRLGGRLASLTNNGEFYAAKGVVGSNSAYIGLDDIKKAGTHVWNDGSRLSFNKWAPKQPSHTKEKTSWWGRAKNWWNSRSATRENCVEMNQKLGGQWNDILCKEKRKPLCEIPSETFPREKCPTGWSHYKDWCYSERSSEANWSEARDACPKIAAGGQLVVPRTQGENKFISGTVIKSKSSFIGVNDLKKENKFADLKNNLIHFRSFNRGQPNNKKSQDCVTMFKDTGKWDDVNCGNKARFVCTIPAQMTRP